jgi:muramidase (phage lysozyme)
MATSKEYLSECLAKPEILAAIQTIRTTEGTTAPDGFHYLFTSSPKNTLRFADLSTHPNQIITANGISSTAAGIAQILYGTWIELCNKYGFDDFSENTQMLMFCALFDLANCLNLIINGQFLSNEVQNKLGNVWASLPLSNFGQPTHTIASITQIYNSALSA